MILTHFNQHDLPIMPLKGAILSPSIYPDSALRPMADLDLLVQPDDFERASSLLIDLGYVQTIIHWKHTEFIRPHNRQVVSKTSEHPDNPRPVELHCYCRESFGGPTLDLSELVWATARLDDLLGRPAWLPSLDTAWLHLLVHATYHFWQGRGRLIHLVDLMYLSPLIADPPKILNLIDARYTYPCLALLTKYLPGTLNPTVLTEQVKRISPAFHRWATGLDLVNGSYLNPNPSGLYFPKALHFAQGHPKEILQAVRFSCLPHLDDLALDHPLLVQSSAPWLAYFLLPLDWAKRIWRTGSPE